ncbi:MAG: hypothetical protein ACRDTA_30430 [Pseudonocardiaceae bacterium]
MRPASGAKAALAAAIASARPTNRGGSGGNPAITCSAGSKIGFPTGGARDNPAAEAPKIAAVPTDIAGRATDGVDPAAAGTAAATARSSGWEWRNTRPYSASANPTAKSSITG